MTGTGQIRVAVNGYGVIGKRVADAVAAQTDMDLTGVADWRARMRHLGSVHLPPTHPPVRRRRYAFPAGWMQRDTRAT